MGKEDKTEVEIRAYRESDQDAVVALWRECGLVVPWNDPLPDIHRKLRFQREMFLVGSLHSSSQSRLESKVLLRKWRTV